MQLQTRQLNQLEIEETWSQTCREEQLKEVFFISESIYSIQVSV